MDESASASSPPAGLAPARTSSRVKTKSQRAVESAHVDRLIARAKQAARSGSAGVAEAADGSVHGSEADGEVHLGGVLDSGNVKAEPADGAGKGKKEGASSVGNGFARTKRSAKGKGSGKKVWCLCKTANAGAMIECGECSDW